MAMAGKIGATVLTAVTNLASYWFGEDQSRYVVSTANPDELIARANAASIPIEILGVTGSHLLTVNEKSISIEDLSAINEEWLPSYMES